MILWKDFILDDVCGPVIQSEALNVSIRKFEVCRKRVADEARIMDDAATGALIQETRQDNEPARMVGQSTLENSALARMEAGASVDHVLRQKGVG